MGSCCHKRKVWYKERIFIMAVITAVVFFIAFQYSPKLFDALIDYSKLIWWAVLLGLLIGGFIDHLVPRTLIEKYLGRRKKRTIFISVLLGFLMSACSHGILAIAIELYKKGANTSSVIAFLLAAPWANLPITILFYSFFGIKALLLVLFAIIIAIITGLIYQVLEKKNLVEGPIKNLVDIPKTKHRAVKGVLLGSWNLAKMVLHWILIGMIVASIARAFVPHEFFMQYMGATVLGMIVVLVIATIIEVCSEGSAPMAFEIFNQTGAFGNSFIFLMAGVATDYTEIGLIWSNIGRKAALWLPVVTVPQVILVAWLFNVLL